MRKEFLILLQTHPMIQNLLKENIFYPASCFNSTPRDMLTLQENLISKESTVEKYLAAVIKDLNLIKKFLKESYGLFTTLAEF